jgi:hypothetical protein
MQSRVEPVITRRSIISMGLKSGLWLACPSVLLAQPEDPAVEPQPYCASVGRVIEALRSMGTPLSFVDADRVKQLIGTPSAESVLTIETILAHYTLIRVRIDRDRTVSTTPGGSRRELVEQGWRSFLIRVDNRAGLTNALTSISDAAIEEGSLARQGGVNREPPLAKGNLFGPKDYAQRWMGFKFYTNHPIDRQLSGIPLEYCIVEIFSRDRGHKSAYLQAYAGGGPPIFLRYSMLKPTGFEADFDCLSSREVTFQIVDWDGKGCYAALTVNDEAGRLYPAPAHRIEPDFGFQPQIYRADGETIRLPDGRFNIRASRGPEYLPTSQAFVVNSSIDPLLRIDLKRWINASQLGWYPGDTHIHAAGCAHYETPTQGVTPEAMIRHVRGEGLAIGDVLTWAPGYYYQKQFFSGHVYEPHNHLEHPEYQVANNVTLQPHGTAHDIESLIRYDVEVSGFPSSMCGHLVLLRLRDQNYPGAARIENWPTWNLPILKWARAQGAVVGYAHSAIGLFVASDELPNYEIPRFDAVGANEFIIDVAHEAVDFTSGAEFSPVAELNIWYHVLNCGFRVAMLGETDFPCISGERVGTGRTYVGLANPPIGDAGYGSWIEGIRSGRLYFGDGLSHFINYQINGHDVGAGDVELPKPGMVVVTAQLAARLEEKPNPTSPRAAWHLEHARIPGTRSVTVEVVVNGQSVAQKTISAGGELVAFAIEIRIQRSSWVALRILPSGHTHPIFVRVGEKPVRTSRRSAQWCLACIDAVWQEKSPQMRPSELKDAKDAYEHARKVYRRIATECEVE